jgi:hypothetical protein
MQVRAAAHQRRTDTCSGGTKCVICSFSIPHLIIMSTCLSAFHGDAYCIATLQNDTFMKKWRQFPTIVARNRSARNDGHYTKFQDLLQSMCLGIRPNGIKGYYWAITYSRRNLPKVNIFILLHRRATAAITARITTAVEEALEDSANVTIAVTMKTKAFHSIVAQRIVEAAH